MSLQALRERISALKKDANNMLANNGDKIWSKEDQLKFDNLADEIDRGETQLARMQKHLDDAAEENFADVERITPENRGKKDEFKRGVELFLRKSDRQLTAEESVIVRNTMSTTTGSEGGYTVQPLVASTVVDMIKAYAFMRQVASQQNTASGADLSWPSSDGTAEVGELVAQNTAAALADIVFGTRPLNAYKFGSKIITIPIELLQDTSVDIIALVMKRLAARIGRSQNGYFTTGTGTAQPMGLVTAASVGKTGTTGQTTSVTYDDLVDLVDLVDVGYLDAAGASMSFMFSQATRRAVRKIKDTAGRPIWTPSYDEGASSKTPDLLLGYPVAINNDMPAMAANALPIAFGDLSKYQIRDAMDVTLFRFDDSAFMSKGQVGFLAWARAGGNLMDLGAVKTYKNSAT